MYGVFGKVYGGIFDMVYMEYAMGVKYVMHFGGKIYAGTFVQVFDRQYQWQKVPITKGISKLFIYMHYNNWKKKKM